MMEAIHFSTPTLNQRGEVIAQTDCTVQVMRLALDESVYMEFALIPAGMFQMGSPNHLGYPDEHPLHPVRVGGFWLGRGLVTQAQWRALMGRLPPCRFHGDDLPLERVSWEDAQTFCRKLSKRSGMACRLPSEAEWEYACRAGTSTPFHFGPTLTTDFANYVGDHLYAEEPKGIYRHAPTPAGVFPSNAFGLFDMHGNLWEWCMDAWHEDYSGGPYSASAWEERSPSGRAARGGSWHEPPANCRSAVRLRCDPREGEEFIGFRVAIDSVAAGMG